jgi:hypothetical protein
MRVVSGSITARLLGAGILALILGCGNGTSPNASSDEIRYTLNNNGLVDVNVQIFGSGSSHNFANVTAGGSVSDEISGGVGDNIRFEVTTATISVHTKICQAGATIVSINGTPQPPSLYGQVDIAVSGNSININCSGGVGEWL